ncbi:MAG: hypothetical protein IPP10_12825 [Candidatus Competibacteraceae bacterium]|nr:hypothetical protein [Candidatus Competibacteraceae bacterium]MBK7982021.1 hypothetical protein [Candidatus Competibacteraceae bacterium]MBK7984859.1 hypothetical protein [Candidatus Competibacteraceae bacterium]MBK8899377.1 hypothetical protein [Candidatus Competibacteraceae bacterium]MBK8964381.1 hypothetical protein [Candidatus Competibacteraceae bacterium]
MMKCNIKKMALAVGTVLGGLSMVPSAQAVNLATDGLGQSLIFPYYTTRAGWNTLFNITNTSDQIVAVKVRFHEGYNSRDVFDFNVVLSPKDVWNGTVSNGPGDVPVFSTSDTSCTVPQIPAAGQPFQGSGANGILAYTNVPGGVQAADGGPADTDRMREGYVTMTMMGSSPPSGLAAGAIHTAARVPVNCGVLQSLFSLNGYTFAQLQGAFPGYVANPLKGAFSLVNAANGWNASGSATTLANFSTGAPSLITAQLPPAQVGFAASFHLPTLASASTAGTVLLDATGAVASGPTGAEGVSFVLQRASIVNQWANRVASAATGGWSVASDWVVTFPTKRFYADTATHEFSGRATGRTGLPAGLAPFTQAFAGGRSCDPVSYTIYDREEQRVAAAGGAVFSPAPSPQGNELCAEVNVLTFGAAAAATSTNVLKSPMPGRLAGNVLSLPGENGWMQLDFRNGARALPVTGFSVINRTSPGANLNESFIVDNAYIR